MHRVKLYIEHLVYPLMITVVWCISLLSDREQDKVAFKRNKYQYIIQLDICNVSTAFYHDGREKGTCVYMGCGGIWLCE